ncbi:hypothetical protein GCM10023185_30440 [Hymenobacter saemangeumensis]|uniref:DUF5723 domain-containing protein n=1 Tax=Hymenobacter saemangeumensis TaxID=1084522 RepID=A0ABP8ILJ8_9BACT
MKRTLRVLPFAALLALPATLKAQNELSNFTATGRGGVVNTFASDYQAIGINPANLGRKGNATVAFTLGEVGMGVASQSLSKTLLKKMIFESGETLPASERAALVSSLTSDNALNLNIDVNAIGLAVTLPSGFGGLAFSHRHRIGVHMALNNNAADIIVNGKNAAIMRQYYPSATTNTNPNAPNVSTVLAGTALQMAWTAEYNVAYGVRVVDNDGFKLSAGAGYRYIQGLGVADIRVGDGDVTAYGAMSPLFSIDYGSIANDPNFNPERGSGLQPVGRGNGYDFGLAAEVGKMIRLGASVVDLGTMTWTANVLTATDQKLQATASNGIDTYNVIGELANQFDADNRSLFTYKAAQERKESLPGKLRLGGGIQLSELFEVGVDMTMPLNKVAGNLASTYVGLGLDFKPVRWLRLSSGVTGGAGYGASLPLGLTLVTGPWEAGFGTRDITGYFSEKAPYYSLGFGLLRFKIGKE